MSVRNTINTHCGPGSAVIVGADGADAIDANVKLDLTDSSGRLSSVVHAFVSNAEWKRKVRL